MRFLILVLFLSGCLSTGHKTASKARSNHSPSSPPREVVTQRTIAASPEINRAMESLLHQAESGWQRRHFVARSAQNSCFGALSQLQAMDLGTVIRPQLDPLFISHACPAMLFLVAQGVSQPNKTKLFRIACESGHVGACEQAVSGISPTADYRAVIAARSCLSGGKHCERAQMAKAPEALSQECDAGNLPSCFYMEKTRLVQASPAANCEMGVLAKCRDIYGKWRSLAEQVLRAAKDQNNHQGAQLRDRVAAVSQDERNALRAACAIYGGEFCSVSAVLEGLRPLHLQVSCNLGSDITCGLLDAQRAPNSSTK